MKTKNIFLLTIIIFSAAIATSCNKKNEKINEHVYYTCPMHPQIHEDKPGKCPVCGMDLVEKNK